jgi:hypothetical protein
VSLVLTAWCHQAAGQHERAQNYVARPAGDATRLFSCRFFPRLPVLPREACPDRHGTGRARDLSGACQRADARFLPQRFTEAERSPYVGHQPSQLFVTGKNSIFLSRPRSALYLPRFGSSVVPVRRCRRQESHLILITRVHRLQH